MKYLKLTTPDPTIPEGTVALQLKLWTYLFVKDESIYSVRELLELSEGTFSDTMYHRFSTRSEYSFAELKPQMKSDLKRYPFIIDSCPAFLPNLKDDSIEISRKEFFVELVKLKLRGSDEIPD